MCLKDKVFVGDDGARRKGIPSQSSRTGKGTEAGVDTAEWALPTSPSLPGTGADMGQAGKEARWASRGQVMKDLIYHDKEFVVYSRQYVATSESKAARWQGPICVLERWLCGPSRVLWEEIR